MSGETATVRSTTLLASTSSPALALKPPGDSGAGGLHRLLDMALIEMRVEGRHSKELLRIAGFESNRMLNGRMSPSSRTSSSAKLKYVLFKKIGNRQR